MQARGFDALGEAYHTPAHRSEEVIRALPPEGKRIALANQDADRLAKHALSLHPQAAPADLEDLDRQVQILISCAKMFGTVLPLFPKLIFERAPKDARLPRVPLPPDWHEWEPIRMQRQATRVDAGVSQQCADAAFRCSRCFLIPFDSESRPNNDCAGFSTALRRPCGRGGREAPQVGFLRC